MGAKGRRSSLCVVTNPVGVGEERKTHIFSSSHTFFDCVKSFRVVGFFSLLSLIPVGSY
jgi:hypothetical protein